METVSVDQDFMESLLDEIKGQQGRELGIQRVIPPSWNVDDPIIRHKYGVMTLEEWVAQWQITPVEYLEGNDPTLCSHDPTLCSHDPTLFARRQTTPTIDSPLAVASFHFTRKYHLPETGKSGDASNTPGEW